jgi:solute carrier family 41
MVAAGILFEKASKWEFLSEVPETLVLIPALLGLKGNLEMTLASRLSTMVQQIKIRIRIKTEGI